MDDSSSSIMHGGGELWTDQPQRNSCAEQTHITEREILDLDLKQIKKEADCILQKEHKLRNASKPHSTPLTLKWLEETYEIAEGVCIPRSALYLHYLDFCEKNDSQPVNAASFGKIIRQQFPQLTTRRLGTRGQSKYHYYGIGIKETSPYYEVMYSKNGIQCSLEGRKENVRQMVSYSPRSKIGTLLPPFPDVKDLNLGEHVDSGKVSTFLMMYRTHCQRILDTVIRANFDEIENLLLHFWQGMPQHIVPLLDTALLVNLVGACDCILYKAIAAVLMPSVLQALPDSLAHVIRKFSRQLEEWLRAALRELPDSLIQMKFELSRRFTQVLRRQTSLNQLCQAARTVTQSGDIVCQMLEDWSHVDFNSICKQTLYTTDRYSEADHRTIIGFYKEFEQLLEEQSPLEAYTDWIDSVVDRCVVRISLRKPGSVRKLARQFLLLWSCFGTRVIRDMTLHSAPSFGSFHLLHLMFDDYVLYVVENLHTQERANDLLRTIRGETLSEDAKNNLCSRALSLLACQSSQPYSYSVGYGERFTSTPAYSHSGYDIATDPSTRPITEQSDHSQSSHYEQNTYSQDYYGHTLIPYNSYSNYNNSSQKYNYLQRSISKSGETSWFDSNSCQKIDSVSQAGSHITTQMGTSYYEPVNNSDVSQMSQVPGYNNSQCYVTPVSNQPGMTDRMQTHYQQGVIYTPYQEPQTNYGTSSTAHGGTDNNNEGDRKRKLEDNVMVAATSKRVSNQNENCPVPATFER